MKNVKLPHHIVFRRESFQSFQYIRTFVGVLPFSAVFLCTVHSVIASTLMGMLQLYRIVGKLHEDENSCFLQFDLIRECLFAKSLRVNM